MNQPGKTLSLFDTICLIVGIIVGAGIYETTPAVAACSGGPAVMLGVWIAGGLLALFGALCYSELATAYPRQGGDYVYLTRAYGPGAGFMFGWSQLMIIRPGDIALMAFVFSRYAATLHAPFRHTEAVYAAGAVLLLSAVNIAGVKGGKWTQNVLACAKVAGLLFIVAAGFLAPEVQEAVPPEVPVEGGLALAMILVLFTYGGWNEPAYAAGEIRSPQKNIRRALVLGVLAVCLLYLLVNSAFLRALGYSGLAVSDAVAVDAVARVLPDAAGRLIAVIICVSALGALNGLIFSGARISYALGRDHRIFHGVGRWSRTSGTPVTALLLQATISLVIVLAAGSFIDTILYTAPAVWLFYTATGIALFRLRAIDADGPRPCRVPLYPLVPLVYCGAAAFMSYNALHYALARRPAGLGILVATLSVGVVLYSFTRRNRSNENA